MPNDSGGHEGAPRNEEHDIAILGSSPVLSTQDESHAKTRRIVVNQDGSIAAGALNMSLESVTRNSDNLITRQVWLDEAGRYWEIEYTRNTEGYIDTQTAMTEIGITEV